MEMLFSQEEVWEMEKRHIMLEGEKRGEARGEARGESKRDALYGELLRILGPLGRIAELIAASSDKSKLSALAREFGLEM